MIGLGQADAFFARQKSERVLAATPNGDGKSLSFPDRGDTGSQAVVHVRGNYETPGPQNTFTQMMMPGMGGDMIPGMSGDMIPGMSGIDSKTLLIGAGVAVE